MGGGRSLLTARRLQAILHPGVALFVVDHGVSSLVSFLCIYGYPYMWSQQDISRSALPCVLRSSLSRSFEVDLGAFLRCEPTHHGIEQIHKLTAEYPFHVSQILGLIPKARNRIPKASWSGPKRLYRLTLNAPMRPGAKDTKKSSKNSLSAMRCILLPTSRPAKHVI